MLEARVSKLRDTTKASSRIKAASIHILASKAMKAKIQGTHQ
jgi:hypothetical protein